MTDIRIVFIIAFTVIVGVLAGGKPIPDPPEPTPCPPSCKPGDDIDIIGETPLNLFRKKDGDVVEGVG